MADVLGDATAKPEGQRTLSRAEEVSVAVEQTRATLGRALRVLVRMIAARGYNLTEVRGKGPDVTELNTELAKLQEDGAECAAAEAAQDILLVGVVGDGATADAPLPSPGTPAAAAGSKAHGAAMAVIVVDKGSVQTARDALARVKAHPARVSQVVVVSRVKPTPFTQRFWSTQTNPRVDFFLLPDVQQVVIDHKLVKPHVVLTAEQAARVRARYAGGKLPKLWTSDPPVKFLGIEPGSVVAVEETWGRGPGSATFFEVEPRDTT
jgi:DNA-directed RNA polymerase subunit H (RpoH/RPB5)